MKEIIHVELYNKENLFEKYNHKKISKELIEYIITSAINFDRKSEIKLVINNKISPYIKCSNMILEGLKDEYNNSFKTKVKNNIIQVIYFFLGCITLFISTYINSEVIREVVLIGGWVFIWLMVELEIYTELSEKRKRYVIKKILCSEIEEK